MQHLGTWVHGTLATDHSALALSAALHPTAAVGGTPTDAAVELIKELENMDRERYAGPVGWVDADGNGEWGIALRCAQLTGERARLSPAAASWRAPTRPPNSPRRRSSSGQFRRRSNRPADRPLPARDRDRGQHQAAGGQPATGEAGRRRLCLGWLG